MQDRFSLEANESSSQRGIPWYTGIHNLANLYCMGNGFGCTTIYEPFQDAWGDVISHISRSLQGCASGADEFFQWDRFQVWHFYSYMNLFFWGPLNHPLRIFHENKPSIFGVPPHLWWVKGLQWVAHIEVALMMLFPHLKFRDQLYQTCDLNKQPWVLLQPPTNRNRRNIKTKTTQYSYMSSPRKKSLQWPEN